MRKALVTSALVPLLLLGAACGGSDGKDAKDSKDRSSTTSTTSTTTALAPDQVDASASPYCADWKELRSAEDIVSTGNKAKDDELRRQHYTELLPTVEKLAADADAEIKPAVEQTLVIIRKVAETGDPEPFNTDASHQIQRQLAAYAVEHCAK
jgi:hypothetical protein